MEAPIPQQVIRPNFSNQLPGQGVTPMMLGMRPAISQLMSSYSNLPDQEEKKRQFAKSVYVSGFEKTVTTAMLEKHFSQVRPVQGIKLPYSKFNENKGYAFVYYANEEDATLSKKKLDRSAILQDKIRVTKTVVAENLSKMIFKMKTSGMTDDQILSLEKTYFNDENLEKQVEKVILPYFGKTVEVNKIIIPVKKIDRQPLSYARVFFYISNPKQAANIVRRAPDFTEPVETKNEYEIVLSFIAELLNKEEAFRQNVTAEIYEYTKKNQSNVLHLKGISYKEGESMNALADELKEFIQKQNMQWQIINCFAAEVKGKGAWANITFATYDDTKKAYEHLKTVRPQFREKSLYGSLRNVKDLRTVVFSVIRNDVEDKQVGKFLQNLANDSPLNTTEGQSTNPIRKYQFFSYNVIEQRSFYMDNEGITVGRTIDQTIPESWRFNNTVPRRLVVHFFNDIDETEMRNLLNDIKVNPEHSKIFMIDEKKSPLRANHQKGHIKNNSYVKHTEVNREKKRRIPIRDKPIRQPRTDYQGQNRMPRQMNQNNQGNNQNQNQGNNAMPKIDYNFLGKTAVLGGIPKITSNLTQNYKPQYGQPPIGMMPPMGKIPMGGLTPPPMGGIVPPMGGIVPPMGMSQPMGGMPPMMGMNKPQMMGGNIPVMGQVPMMSKPSIMGSIPSMGQKPINPAHNQPQAPKQQ